MALSVLIANQVAERCFLNEALYWVALSRFPLAHPRGPEEDGREDDEWVDSIEPPYTQDIVSREECLFAGLPINPEWEAEQSFEYYSHPEEVERWLSYERDPERIKARQVDLKESVAYFERLELWNSALKAYLDLYIAKLFVALRQGRVVASGKPISPQLLPLLLKQAEESEMFRKQSFRVRPVLTESEIDERARAPVWDRIERVPIAKEFWTSNGINWKYSCAQNTATGFGLILVETEKLFQEFPIPKVGNLKQVSQIGDGYVLFDEAGNTVSPPVKSRGRPSLNWEEFGIEMARRLRDGGFPEKQEALIVEMQAWCKACWGVDVGRSTLLQKIKPYYEKLVR